MQDNLWRTAVPALFRGGLQGVLPDKYTTLDDGHADGLQPDNICQRRVDQAQIGEAEDVRACEAGKFSCGSGRTCHKTYTDRAGVFGRGPGRVEWALTDVSV